MVTLAPKGADDAKSIMFDTLIASIISVDGASIIENEGFTDFTTAFNFIYGFRHYFRDYLLKIGELDILHQLDLLCNNIELRNHLEKNHNDVTTEMWVKLSSSEEKDNIDGLMDLIAYINNFGKKDEDSQIFLQYLMHANFTKYFKFLNKLTDELKPHHNSAVVITIRIISEYITR